MPKIGQELEYVILKLLKDNDISVNRIDDIN